MLCSFLFALSLWAGAALAAPPSPGHAADQARLFIRKGWYEDAAHELRAALESPEGQASFEVHWLLAQVSYELQDIGGAAEHARLAAGLAPGPDEEAACWQLVQDIDATFGSVRVSGPQDGVQSRLQLEGTSTQFDPELKRFIAKKTLELTEPVALPLVVWLPSGTYLVNGQEVTIAAGHEAGLQLPVSALGAKGLASLQVLRVEVGGGFGVLLGERVANLRPAIEAELTVVQPVGRMLLGLTFDKSFRGYEVDDYPVAHSPTALGGGLLIGTEVLLGGPLAFRPSLGYRFGLLPGLPFDCRESHDGLSCAPVLEGGDATDRLYATARTHTGTLQLALDWRQGGRVNALGLGVRAAVDQVFGSVPAEGTGAHGGSEEEIVTSIQDGGFHATGIRILANLSLAL
ncbi:MAG: tetratricopeptide repeat protein [Pseudomonadota bacterium]